ncbi:MAG: hypothetical protein KDE47_12660 [Caldilineaceae bacterium]|nr:hypothetical protein [Caldilineaceae bacterium]MCB0094061.1 hypothetical protein [Caldilineaceae bacterium]
MKQQQQLRADIAGLRFEMAALKRELRDYISQFVLPHLINQVGQAQGLDYWPGVTIELSREQYEVIG